MSLQSATHLVRTTLLLVTATLAACSTQGPTVSPDAETGNKHAASSASYSLGERAARIAQDQIGVPYRYGGQSTTGFDCSGLVHYSYATAGKNVPRTTGGLWQRARPVSGSDLLAGDVLFFHIEGKMSHVGLYLGDGQFVHAPASGRRVSLESLSNEFYQQAFVRGGRP